MIYMINMQMNNNQQLLTRLYYKFYWSVTLNYINSFMLDPKFPASRRFSPMKFTKSQAERAQCYSPSMRNQKAGLHTDRYFCHYQNAVYMGGADCFKKNGYGILFMDNGACALTYHSHDNMLGHNIIFRDRSMTSMVAKTNKTKFLCYRTGPYLLSVHYNWRNSVDGTGFIVNFNEKKLYKLSFYHSKVEEKQQVKDKNLLNKIFSKHDYSDIVGDDRQAEVLNLNFSLSQSMNYYRNGNTLTIGFIDKQQNSNKNNGNGLVFKLKINDSETDFDVMLLERGYFEGDRMQKFGEKHFQNQNYYVGGFKYGKFNGFGVLITPQKQNWTFGSYKNGELTQIIESSVNSKSKVNQIIKRLHSNQDSYIQMNIKISPTQAQIKSVLKAVLQAKVSSKSIEDPQQMQRTKIQNLKIIRDDYVSRKYQGSTQKVIKEQLSKSRKKLNRVTFQGLKILEEKNKTPQKVTYQTQSQNTNEFGQSSKRKKFNTAQQPSLKLNISPIKDKQKQKSKQKITLNKQLKNKKTLKSNQEKTNEKLATPMQQLDKYFKDNHNTTASSHRTADPEMIKNNIKQKNTQNLIQNALNLPKYRGAAHILIRSDDIVQQQPQQILSSSSSQHKFISASSYRYANTSLIPKFNTYGSDYYQSHYHEMYYPSALQLLHNSNNYQIYQNHSSIDHNTMSRHRHFKYLQDKDAKQEDQKSNNKKYNNVNEQHH